MQEERPSIIDSLYRISSVTTGTEDPHEALQTIIEEIVQQIDCSSASICLVNPDTNELDIEVSRGLPDQWTHLRLPLTRGVTGWVAMHGKPLVVNDVTQDARYVSLKPSIRSEMAVPMQTEGSIIGVVNIDSERLNAFDDEDLKVLTLLTSEATRVIHRLWLFNQLRMKNDQLQALISAGRNLVAELDLNEVLKRIAREARILLNCRMCAILLRDPTDDTLRLEVISGAKGSIDYTEEIQAEDSSMEVAIRRKKQVEVLDLVKTEEIHFMPLTQREGLRSLLCTPMIYEDSVIGVLNAYTDRTHRFNDDEKRIFATMASLGAVAIQNSRLYGRVFDSEERLRKSERLTTLGLLAAEIAHEIRNPLTVIKLLFETLQIEFQEGDPRIRDMSVIGEKLTHLENIVQRVLEFGKTHETLHARWCINELVQDVRMLMRLKLEQCRVQSTLETPDGSLYVEVNKGQLQQVLLNLMLNALQAMPEGGTLNFRIERVMRDHAPYVAVSLSDSGAGVPPSVQGKIFDSFLTAKKGGTGLGLSIVKRILKSHNGDIELVATGDSGSTFRFWLPEVE